MDLDSLMARGHALLLIMSDKLFHFKTKTLTSATEVFNANFITDYLMETCWTKERS